MTSYQVVFTKALQVLCLAVLAITAAPLRAASITFSFSGNLLTANQGGGVSDPNNDLGGLFHNGESFTGTVTYSTNAIPEGGDDSLQYYVSYLGSGIPSTTISINFPGGYTFTDSANYLDYIAAQDPSVYGYGAAFEDERPATPSFWQGSLPPQFGQLLLEFDTPPNPDLSIPTSLSLEDPNNGEIAMQIGFYDSSSTSVSLLGQMTSVTLDSSDNPPTVPEPSTLLLLGTGFGLLVRRLKTARRANYIA